MEWFIKGLGVLAVAMMVVFLALWAREIIMQSGTVAQVMSSDFDLERTMVEAGQ